MTQIVLMLYEDPQADHNSDQRFHIELHFSPGVKCHLEEARKDPRFNAFVKEHKSITFPPKQGDAQTAPAESRQEEKSGSKHPRLTINEEDKDVVPKVVEKKTGITRANSPKKEGKSSIEETERLSSKSPRLEGTDSEHLKVAQVLPAGSSEETRTIISRRHNSGRSRSECEYPASDNLDPSAGNIRYKAISKSLGM